MQDIDNLITFTQIKTPDTIRYTDLSHGASLFGICARVQLENRVLEDYRELDPALGQNVVGAILSILAYQEIMGSTLADGRLSVCLARLDSGKAVEVDLGVYHRCHGGQKTYSLRFIGESVLRFDRD